MQVQMAAGQLEPTITWDVLNAMAEAEAARRRERAAEIRAWYPPTPFWTDTADWNEARAARLLAGVDERRERAAAAEG